jgi:GNAT superfamily N-acetyltransferase
VQVVPVATGDALDTYARVLAEVMPESAETREEMEYGDATYPGAVRFLALEAGAVVGAAGAERIFSFPPEFDGLWAYLAVLPSSRGRGVGTALHRSISAAARTAGKSALHFAVTDVRPEGVDWLARRGYREIERTGTVTLDLAGLATPAIEPPPGVAIVSLAERPDLTEQVYEMSPEVLGDIPGTDEPFDAGTYEEFRRGCIEAPGTPLSAFLVALEDGDLAGYARMVIPAGRPATGLHAMTGVRRSSRGRGIATALKRAQIAWAIEAGLAELETENNVENGPMRAVNARLGYRPGPTWLVMRGPLT